MKKPRKVIQQLTDVEAAEVIREDPERYKGIMQEWAEMILNREKAKQ